MLDYLSTPQTAQALARASEELLRHSDRVQSRIPEFVDEMPDEDIADYLLHNLGEIMLGSPWVISREYEDGFSEISRVANLSDDSISWIKMMEEEGLLEPLYHVLTLASLNIHTPVKSGSGKWLAHSQGDGWLRKVANVHTLVKALAEGDILLHDLLQLTIARVKKDVSDIEETLVNMPAARPEGSNPNEHLHGLEPEWEWVNDRMVFPDGDQRVRTLHRIFMTTATDLEWELLAYDEAFTNRWFKHLEVTPEFKKVWLEQAKEDLDFIREHGLDAWMADVQKDFPLPKHWYLREEDTKRVLRHYFAVEVSQVITHVMGARSATLYAETADMPSMTIKGDIADNFGIQSTEDGLTFSGSRPYLSLIHI